MIIIPFRTLRIISKIVKNLTLFPGWIRFERVTIFLIMLFSVSKIDSFNNQISAYGGL